MCAVSVQAKKIYLFPSSDWQLNNAKMGAYTWNSSNSNDNKPQLMSQISGVTPVVYEVDIPDSHNKVIFLRMNNTATAFDWSKEWSRTEQNIPSDGKNCFFIKGWTDATKWDTYTYTVVGNKDVLGSDWDTGNSSNDMVKIDDDNWALVKRNVSLKKNTNYEYKLVMAHSWDYWSTPSTNAKLTVTADGTYDVMFTYNYKTNKLTHTAVLPQTIYCINTQEWDKVSIHNWLTDKITTTWPGDAMTKTGEKWAGYDIYKKEISGLHKYCIFNNNNNGKQTSDLTIEGTYYELGSGKWYKELPTPKICWKGDVNNWSEDNTFAVTSDPNLLTTTVTLSEGEHDFKITICDLWLGNSGTMKRHGESVHEGGWEFKNKKDDGTETDKCKIEADIAGDYIFTWNISEKKLTVTYPSYPDLSNQPSPIYFKPTEAWKTNNPRFAAYFCKGNMKDKWEDLTDTDGDGIYEVNNAKEHTTVIIVRMNPAYDENRWNTYEEDHSANKPVWNKTEDLLIPMDGNDFFIMDGFDFNTGYWSLYIPTIQLVDGDNSATLTKYSGKKVNAQVNRTFVVDGGYYTICLPFDLDAEKIGKALQISSITENVADQGMNVVFTEVVEGTLKAGQPYLVLPSENIEDPIFGGVTIVNTTGETTEPVSGAGINITFTGIINGSGTTNGSTEYYVGAKGWLYNGEVDKLGLRAFFTITDAAGQKVKNIRARVVTRENAATGFENITNGENTTIKVIENGQLIIIRNGEKFNAQGQKL